MKVPVRPGKAVLTINKSRFLSHARFFDDPSSIKRTTLQIREENPGCDHVVYAYAVGKAGDTLGMSDDHEPKGTAGRPVLEVVKGSGVTNLLITVVRYFGGTKLGTGGLVRAYTEAAQLSLSRLTTEELVEKSRFELEIPYNLYETVKRLIVEQTATIADERFEESVVIRGELHADRIQQLERLLAELSSGQLSPAFYDGSSES